MMTSGTDFVIIDLKKQRIADNESSHKIT